MRNRGRDSAPLVVVGSSPTREDLYNDQVFSDGSGNIMLEICQSLGYTPDQVVFTTVFEDRKTTSEVTVNDIQEAVAQRLLPFINEHPRYLVVGLGNVGACAVGLLDKPEKINSARGAVHYPELLGGIPAVASIDPYYILAEPDQGEDVYLDLRRAKNTLRGDRVTQVPMQIIDITDPAQMEDILEECKEWNRVAYDYETDRGEKHLAKAVSLSICNGRKNDKGEYIVYFWCGYDKLIARYPQYLLDEFGIAFEMFFARAGIDYGLVAWNMQFDDAVTECNWFQNSTNSFRGCQYDMMLLSWQLNSRTRNGLKDSTERDLGYPDYDKEVDECISATVARRGRVLKHPDDFKVIEYFGMVPEEKVSKKGTKSYRWPETLDKKAAAWAMLEYEVLRLYNAYDAVYTRIAYDHYMPLIKKYDLQVSARHRLRLCKELLRCELRGFQCDVAINRKLYAQLDVISKDCESQLQEYVKEHFLHVTESPNFASSDQVARILFGDAISLPVIAMPGASWKTRQDIEAFNIRYYSNVKAIREARDMGELDVAKITSDIVNRFCTTFKADRSAVKVSMRAFYFDGEYVPTAFTKKGKPSVASAVLEALVDTDNKHKKFVKLLLMQRKADKLMGTFVDAIYKKLDADHILRYRLNGIGARSGRISSSGPNCQNFNKYIRGQMVPRAGYVFIEFDLSQAEVRAIAAFSGDAQLIAALDSSDIHRAVGALIFKKPENEVTDNERRAAKTIVFGLIYGMGAFRLALALGITLQEAEAFIAQFFSTFPGMKKWLDNQIELAQKPPFKTRTPWGTMRSVRNIFSIDKKIAQHYKNVCQNHPIQGAAGELTMYYICEIMDAVRMNGWDVHMVNTVHDSCTLEVPYHLVSGEEVTVLDKDGKPKNKMVYTSPIIDLIQEVVATPAPVAPLDSVTFKADIDVSWHWSTEPDVKRAIDPDWDKEEKRVFPWELIKPFETLDKEEAKEIEELQDMWGTLQTA